MQNLPDPRQRGTKGTGNGTVPFLQFFSVAECDTLPAKFRHGHNSPALHRGKEAVLDFNPPVKWLILLLVMVFDPLAVALTVGFNVALVRDRRPRAILHPSGESGSMESQSDDAAGQAAQAPRSRWWLRVAGVTASLSILAALLWGGVHLRDVLHRQARTSHAALVPGESFAVATLRPPQFRQAAGSISSGAGDLIGGLASQPVVSQLRELLGHGFDADADVYAFIKYPPAQTEQSAHPAEAPAMLCGLVARVTDPAAAEAGLSKFAESLAATLGRGEGASASMSRSRSMVRFGRGRYLDPRGGFFTFGLTDREAILILEVEGDPRHPSAEAEIRRCLAGPDSSRASYAQAPIKLPPRAMGPEGAVSVWFDAARCFAQMPKNPAAQARFQQLHRHLGFDLLLTIKHDGPGQFKLVGDYAYATERFKNDSDAPTPLELLAQLGSPEPAGVPGRLMDRCAATLDFDSLIEQMKLTLGKPPGGGSAQVLVEKSIASDRQGKFTLTAHLDPQAGPPVVAALENQAH